MKQFNRFYKKWILPSTIITVHVWCLRILSTKRDMKHVSIAALVRGIYYNVLKWESRFTLGLNIVKNTDYIKNSSNKNLWVLIPNSCKITCVRKWHVGSSNSWRKLKLHDLSGRLAAIAAQTWTRLNMYMTGQTDASKLSKFLQCVENCLGGRMESDTTRRDLCVNR